MQNGDSLRHSTRKESSRTGLPLIKQASPSKKNGAKAVFIVDAEYLVGKTDKINIEVEKAYLAIMNSIHGAEKRRDLKQLPEIKIYARGQLLKEFTREEILEIQRNPKKADELLFYLFSCNLLFKEIQQQEQDSNSAESGFPALPIFQPQQSDQENLENCNVVIFCSQHNLAITQNRFQRLNRSNLFWANIRNP